jgi:hypothetical protein
VVLGYNNPRCSLLRQAVGEGYPVVFFARSLANVFGVGQYIPDGVHVIANAPFTASVLSAATGARPDVVLPLVDLEAYRAPTRERRYVTFVNPMPEKGLDVAQAVARALPERKFLFVKGKWGDRSYGSVHGAPNVEVWEYQDDMRAVYAVTDVLLMPSQWPETFGRVALEAQVNGIPVVASPAGGIPYVVGAGGLLVARKGDPQGYVEALTRLAQEPELYATLSAAAVENSRRPEFVAERQVDGFVARVEAARAAAGTRPAAPAPAAREEVAAPEGPAGAQGLAAAVLVISLLQGALFAVASPGAARTTMGILLALAGLWAGAGGLRRCTRRHFHTLALVLFLELAFFAAWALPVRPLPAPRQMYVGLYLGYGALLVATVLAATRAIRLPEALLLSTTLAGCLFATNFVLRFLDVDKAWPGAEWTGGAEPHPVLGYVYRPNSTASAKYPDNPRGYFDVSDPRNAIWNLETYEGSAARLAFPPQDKQAVRIEIDRVAQTVPWHVQIRKAGLYVKEGRTYVVSFRARADAPRRIAFAVSQAHEPWQPLGLYGEADLGSEWRSVRQEFRALKDDDAARVHFDLGGHAAAVELTDVTLREPEGSPIEPPVREAYTISFRFDDHGCRGPMRESPRPPGVFRVLLLGDSYVLGVGVHERDAVGERLQALLNQRTDGAPVRYEVVNCGVSGYSTREERLFYETVAWRYEPQLVLVGMVFNDATSWSEDVAAGRTLRPGKAGEVFPLWDVVKKRTSQRPPSDFSRSVEELKTLRASAAQHGARLAAFAFRHSELVGEWKSLVTTMEQALPGAHVPFVDLGPAITRDHSFERLIVHEIDGHPNEIGHRLAAQALLDFLHRERLLQPPAAPAASPAVLKAP